MIAIADSNSSDLSDMQKCFDKEFETIFNYVEEIDRNDAEINNSLCDLKENFLKVESQSKHYKELYLKQQKNCENVEKEALQLINDIKNRYELNIIKIKKKYEEETLELTNTHKIEIQKLQTECEKIRSDKDVGTNKPSSNTESDINEKVDKQFYEDQIKQLNQEIKRLKTSNETSTKKINQFETKEKAINIELEKLKKENNAKNVEIKSLKENISELKNSDQKKIKEYEKEIESQKKIIELQNGNKSDSGVEENHDDYGKLKSQLLITESDLRKANKQLESKIEVCRILREELAQLKQQSSENEKELKAKTLKIDEFTQNVSKFENEIENSKVIIENKNTEIVGLKCMVENNKDNWNLKIKELTETVEKCRTESKELTKKNDLLVQNIEKLKRKQAQQEYEIKMRDNEIEQLKNEHANLSKRYENLKKVHQVMDKDMEQYSIKVKNKINLEKLHSKDEISTLSQQLEDYKKENSHLKIELESLNCQIIEMKDKYENLIQKNQIEYDRIVEQLQYEKEKNARLEEKLANLEKMVEEQESKMTITLAQKDNELVAIKEEASRHITAILSLEKENEQLQQEIDWLREELYEAKEQIEQFANDVKHSQKCYDETVTQHKKLLDYIQCKSAEKKKSKFSFPSKMISNVKKLEDLEKDLKQARQKNACLMQELNDLNEAFDSKSKEVEILKDEVRKFKQFYFKNTIFDTDVTHRFISFIGKINNVCMSCAKAIRFGQKAKKCKDCGAMAHSGCKLFNNCGLSVNTVRKQILGNGDRDEDGGSVQFSEDYDTDSLVIPTAPEQDSDDLKSIDSIEDEINGERLVR